MAKKERVNLTVNQETKNHWENVVDDSTEYSSLSDLIRTSVTHELLETPDAAPRNADGREVNQTPPAEAQTEALESVADTLSRIESTLTDLDSRLTSVEKEVTATAKADLKQQIYEALPKYKTGKQLDGDSAQEGKSAMEIADEIGADKDRVYSVIQQLMEQSGLVREVMNIDGQQFFAREDEV